MERGVKADLIGQIVKSLVLILLRIIVLVYVVIVLAVFLGFFFGDALILFVLIVVDFLINFEGHRAAGIVPQKRALWTHNRVDLAHRLHNLQVGVVHLGWDQIYVPHRVVRMEENDRLHRQLGEVGEVLQEARKDYRVGLDRKFELGIRESLNKLDGAEVLQDEVLEHDHDARH